MINAVPTASFGYIQAESFQIGISNPLLKHSKSKLLLMKQSSTRPDKQIIPQFSNRASSRLFFGTGQSSSKSELR